MTTRKTWSESEKLQIVLEGLAPRTNVEALCRTHGIHSSQFYKWRERALASMKEGLRSQAGTVELARRQENARLKKLVLDLTIANDVLKDHLEGRTGEKTSDGSS
ncbi:MAG: transposase [Thermoplasmata archaeon]